MIKLEHKKLPEVRHFLNVSNLQSVDDLIDAISTAAIVNAKHLKGKAQEDQQNTFKGNAFEIWVEFFLKYQAPTNNGPAVIDYHPINEKKTDDYGVDGQGLGLDKTPATIQIKFRSNPLNAITYEECAKFHSQSVTPAPFGFGVVNTDNMVFISTAFQLNQHAAKFAGAIRMRHYGLDQLKQIVGPTNPTFWEAFAESFNNSHPIKQRERKKRYRHQQQMNELIRNFLDNGGERGWVGCGTGGGKTYCISDAISYYLGQQGSQIAIVAAPRIQLCEQIKNVLWSSKEIDFERFTFHSGGAEELDFYKGDLIQNNRSSTDPNKVVEWVNNNRSKDMVIFTTYHSSEKLLKALNQKGITEILYIGDECHNLVRHEFANVLDRNIVQFWKFIGFTATGLDTRDPNGTGMNVFSRWGNPLVEISPIRLVSDGITVPPRAFIMEVKDNIDPKKLEVDIVRKMVREFKDQQCPNSDCRVLVTCTSVDMAHHFVDDNVLNDLLPEFEKFVVTSNGKLMKGRNRDGQLSEFSDAPKALIFHYDMLGEGIDVPGVTAVLMLRGLSRIKAIQNVGRAGRIINEDRVKLAEDQINVKDREGWTKPYGWILCPLLKRDTESIQVWRNTMAVLDHIRTLDYDFHIEDYIHVGDSKGKYEVEIEPYQDINQHKDQEVKDFEFSLEEQNRADVIDLIETSLSEIKDSRDRTEVLIKNADSSQLAEINIVHTLSELDDISEDDIVSDNCF